MMKDIPGNADAWKTRMDAAVNHLQHELGNLRTSRPVASLLDNIKVSSTPGKHGASQPLASIASIVVRPPSSMLVTPHDPNLMTVVQTAIKTAFPSYGVTAASATAITVSIPRVTGEQREKMVKETLKLAENAKVVIRNVRKDWLKDLEKRVLDASSGKGAAKGKTDSKNKQPERTESGLSKDEFKRVEKAVQGVTDDMVSSVDTITKQKEKDLLES